MRPLRGGTKRRLLAGDARDDTAQDKTNICLLYPKKIHRQPLRHLKLTLQELRNNPRRLREKTRRSLEDTWDSLGKAWVV